MAEKEERIWIDYPLPKNTGAIEARRCTTMTRQEAIERMNKAACKANKRCIGGICETCTSKMPHEEYTHQNEAALNALLEG